MLDQPSFQLKSNCATSDKMVETVPGYHKINYDGVIFNNSDEVGIEVVVRDQEGTCIATLLQKIRYPQSVDNTEALVARRAV